MNKSDRCVYSKFSGDNGIIICLYVDNMLMLGIEINVVKNTKDLLSSNFDRKDNGVANAILGIKIIKIAKGLYFPNHTMLRKYLKNSIILIVTL